MWSAVNESYLQKLIETNRGDYPYYVAHTCTYYGSSGSYNSPSFKVYFSADPIRATGLYSYVFEDNPVVYSVISGSGSSYSTDPRVSVSFGYTNLSVDDYEFVYTNAEFQTISKQPDVMAQNVLTQTHFDGISLILGILLISTIIVKLIRR